MGLKDVHAMSFVTLRFTRIPLPDVGQCSDEEITFDSVRQIDHSTDIDRTNLYSKYWNPHHTLQTVDKARENSHLQQSAVTLSLGERGGIVDLGLAE